MKMIYTRPDGGISIVIATPKEKIEEVLGSLTDEQYQSHIIEKSVPEDAINVRVISDENIPDSRVFRNAWCDVTQSTDIDIDCSKAKEIVLENVRRQRKELLEQLDEAFLKALESGDDTTEITLQKQQLRDITNPIKALETRGKINDEALLNTLRQFNNILNKN